MLQKLINDEAFEARMGGSLPQKLHPSLFICMGLEIKDQKQVVWLLSYEHSLTNPIQATDHCTLRYKLPVYGPTEGQDPAAKEHTQGVHLRSQY